MNRKPHSVKVTVFYVGSSLPAPLAQAERDIRTLHKLDVTIRSYNCGSELSPADWSAAEKELLGSDVVFILHVTNQENAVRIIGALEKTSAVVIAINCMTDLMRTTRLGKLKFGGGRGREESSAGAGQASAPSLVRKLGGWLAESLRKGHPGSRKASPNKTIQYTKLIGRLPGILKFIPGTGRVRDAKNYIQLFAYFLQPTPRNIRSMVLYAIKHYVPGHSALKIDPAESLPALALYHPDSSKLFDTFADYRKWYEQSRGRKLESDSTIGLLLMRPQVVSNTRRHYDALIRAIESEGLAVLPTLGTFMDNREACRAFFLDSGRTSARSSKSRAAKDAARTAHHSSIVTPGADQIRPRISQLASLTGFSFVGGPAMHDGDAAVEFLSGLNIPLRSFVSLDVQTIDHWERSKLGLNPIQAAMQIAIPEIDGATEPFVFGGMPGRGEQPEPIEDRCRRIARRLARWNRLRTTPPSSLRLAFVLFCFPPNKGNIGTAAELDVFPSLAEMLRRLESEGYGVRLPEAITSNDSVADRLRQMILEEAVDSGFSATRVCYRMGVEEYRRLCPHVDEIEKDWGRAPGKINSNGRELLISGIELGNVFIGIQPTFGYEGDPMRLLMAESGGPHHGFMALYTYIEKIFRADAVVHVGTHGSLEFMPGKQAGLSSRCWPDRLIGELPNIYIYSVNNPSEGTIARRRSYGELISYLTPPIENAGLYKGLASLKETLSAYRQCRDEREREQLFAAIEEQAQALNL
ncbi:MAG TPA: cobaltochelatase subunit CobN [Blastocatellia bacterium]|nr:cobaltochelatase subunit CobN [Blastocatellia bacterium]